MSRARVFPKLCPWRPKKKRICCVQLGFPRLEEQVASTVCEAASWASLAAIDYRGCLQGWDRPGCRQICQEPSQIWPCLLGWLQPAGFPGSGVVLHVFSRLGAPRVTRQPSFNSPSPHPPLCNLWELKLLQLRFPTQDLPKLPPLQAAADQPPTSGTSKPSESLP